MARERDRSAPAVARAWLTRGGRLTTPTEVADLAALVRAVRRECAAVAREPYSDAVAALAGDEPQAVGDKIADAIARLNRAPRRER